MWRLRNKRPIPPLYYEVKTAEDMALLTENAKRSGIIAIWLGLSGKNPISDVIYTIWIAADQGGPVYIIDLHSSGYRLINDLNQIFYANTIEKVFFNSIQDCAFLEKFGFALQGVRFDLMIAYRVLFAGLLNKKPTFENLINCFFGRYPGYVSSLLNTDGMDRSVRYNQISRKVIVLLALRGMLFNRLNADWMILTAYLEFKCSYAVTKLWLTGIKVDFEKMNAIHIRFKKECHEAEEEFLSCFGRQINLNDPESIKEALNSHPDVVSENISFSDTQKITLKKYVKNIPDIQALIDYKHARSIAGYAKQVLKAFNMESGRVYPVYDPLGAVTGRFSCSSPPLQAMPKLKEFRACFIAGKKRKLVIADYSQIELRVAAEISGDKKMIEAFRDKIDFHKLTATLITKKAIDDVTDSERKAGKAINFGIIYGMGPETFVSYAFENYDIQLSIDDAMAHQNAFFEEYSGLAQWRAWQSKLNPPVTRTLNGRVRYWDQRVWVSPTELINTPIQGTAADIIKESLSRVFYHLGVMEALLVGCIHDEIILEVDDYNAKRVASSLVGIMEESAKLYLKTVPVVVDVKIDDHWS